MVTLSAPLIQSTVDAALRDNRQSINRNTLPQQTLNGDTLNAIYQSIRTLYIRLQGLDSLSPKEKTNVTFIDLVDFVVNTQLSESDMYKLMQMPKMAAICDGTRKICAEAETLLETHWSERLTDGEGQLNDFPYHRNYLDLMEYHLLCGQGARPHHIIFIGSGPLPLSSLTLASQHLVKDWTDDDWSIVNVDVCPQANQLGSRFTAKVFPEVQGNITFVDCNAAHIDPTVVSKADVIYLAALAGLDMKSKHEIIHNLVMHMRPGARLLLRSANCLRRLLYPDIDDNALVESCKGQLEVEVICHPRNFVINSVVVARRV